MNDQTVVGYGVVGSPRSVTAEIGEQVGVKVRLHLEPNRVDWRARKPPALDSRPDASRRLNGDRWMQPGALGGVEHPEPRTRALSRSSQKSENCKHLEIEPTGPGGESK